MQKAKKKVDREHRKVWKEREDVNWNGKHGEGENDGRNRWKNRPDALRYERTEKKNYIFFVLSISQNYINSISNN